MTTTRFSSLAAWAQSLGSKAKTPAGQRKAILASFAPIHRLVRAGKGLGHDGISSYSWQFKTTRAAYYAQQQRARQEKFAANHPLTLSMPAPAQKRDVQGGGSEVALDALQVGYNYARLGAWYIRLTESERVDWNYYAKSYKYPKIWKEDRTVLIRRVKADGTMEAKDIAVDAWRGNFLLNALIESSIVERNKVSSALRSVQLHPAYAVREIRRGTLSVFERTLGGQHYDYCVLWHGITFHAASVRAAIKGLREKLHSVIAAKNAPITWELGKKLGFCDEGMKQFARDFNLDTNGRYSAQQIEEAVRANPNAAAPYMSELCKLAEAVGHPVAECA